MTVQQIENVRRIAAFSDDGAGGNPAGVLIADRLPSDQDMQRIAAQVGYSETAFAAPEGGHWRVRYFAPEGEVDFCGHATIALGMALSDAHGPGTYPLKIKPGEITVTGARDECGRMQLRLVSPATKSRAIAPEDLAEALDLFRLQHSDLDPNLPPAIANAGNDHLVLALRDRSKLTGMQYDLTTGRQLMESFGLTTINLVHAETPRVFHSRNAFAIGGVLEDPATGAAAAAFAGYLRDIDWPHGGRIEILQGFDMGQPSRLTVELTSETGSPVAVSGQAREINPILPN